MTRYATVRLLAAALFAVLVVGGTTASEYAAEGGVGVGTILLALLLGVVSFGVLAVVLLFDSRRRHQLGRALGALTSSDRLLVLPRRAADDREPRAEQLAEVRRHLDYALEGLWRAVGSGPTAVVVASGAQMIEDDRRPKPSPLAIEAAVREARPSATSRPPETEALVTRSTGAARGLRKLPVSPRVAQGALLVRVSVGRHRQSLGVAAAHTRLTVLRDDDRRSRRRAEQSRWLIRAFALLIVPGVLTYEVSSRTSWFGGVWDGAATRDGFLGALSLGALGSAWTFVVTRREHGLHEGLRPSAESHAVRSLLASEQLALRLAAGVAPSDAWQVVARTNHFPPGSAIPARAVEDALALVEALRRASRRRQLIPARRRLAAIARPLVSCLLPAAVIIFVL